MKLPRISRFNLPFFRNLQAFTAARTTTCAVLVLGFSTFAEGQVFLNPTGDPSAGSSSWAVAGRWSDGLAPSGDKDYVNNVLNQLLRTPNNSTSSTAFAGKSLTISNGATLLHKGAHNTTVTVSDLRLEDGGAVGVVDSGRTLTVDGNIAIGTGGGVFSVTQNLGTTMVIAAPVTGSTPLSKINAGTVRLDGNFSGYNGTFSVTAGGARLNSAFGGSVIASDNTTISGEAMITGNLTLGSGNTALNLTANGATPGSLGTMGDLTLNSVINVSLLDGFPATSAPFTILNYDGVLTGSAANFAIVNAATYRNPVLSVDTPKIITMSIGRESRTWTGENSTVWDINAAENWLEGDKRFFQADDVVFGDTGAGNVVITGVLTPSSITINSSSDYNFTAAAGNLIAGPGSLTKTGTGTASIGGSNTFSGGITVAGGTLRGNGFSQVFGANGQVITVLSGATLDMNGAMTAPRDFNGVIIGAGVGGAGAVVNNGATQGQGLGSLTLTGDAAIGGTAQWDVRPITADVPGKGFVNLAGFTLTKVGANNINFADLTAIADGSIHINEGSLTVARSIFSGAGAINVNSGTSLRFGNYTSGSFEKAINLADDSYIANSGANFTLASPVTVTGNTRIDTPSNSFTIANPITGTGNIEKTGTADLYIQAPIAHGGTTTLTAGRLFINSETSTVIATDTILGTGTLGFGRTGGNINTVYTLSGNSVFQGNFRVLAGIVEVPSVGTLGTLAPDPVDPVNLTLPKTIQMVNRGAGVHLNGTGGDIDLPVGYHFNISNDVPESPAIGNLAGDNTIRGNISINTGGGGGTLTVFGGSLTVTGNVSNVSTPRSVILGGTGGSGKITGVISNGSNSLGVDKNGPNTWILTGENTNSGPVTINGGTLQIGDGGATGTPGSGSVTNHGSLVINRSGELTLAGAISGTGSLTHAGPGLTILNVASSYTGDTLISNGTLSPSAASFDDQSTIRISGEGTLDLFHAQTDTVKSLVIDGVPQAAGLWGRIGSIAALNADFETDFITSDGLLNVTTGGSIATPFEEWAALLELPDGKDGPADDADSDGLTNLQEFAFDGNPLSGANDGKTVVKIAPVAGVPTLTLTLPVRAAVGAFSGGNAISATADGVTYLIEGSGGLATWLLEIDEVTGADATAIQAGLPALNSGWTYRSFRSPGPIATTDAEFLRAGVSE
jgi:autotransporter-associated beta strand protein